MRPTPSGASVPLFTTTQLIVTWVVLAGIVLYPIASVQVPGLGDYLNHLARMHVLATLGHSPDLQRYYEVRWEPVPYLGMDAVVPFIARMFPIYDAGRIFIALCLLLPVIGTAALSYAVHGRPNLFPLMAFLFSYNSVLSLGFLNYLFSVGLCLLLLAGWVATETWPRWRRAIIFAFPALTLYFCHIYGFGAYCIAVAGLELGRAWHAKFRPFKTVIADWLAAATQAIPALIALLALGSTEVASGTPFTKYGTLSAKVLALESPFVFLGGRAELALGALVISALAAALLRGRVKLAPHILPAVAAIALAAALMPEWLLSVWGTDLRLPIVVVLILISGLSFNGPYPHQLLFVSVLVPLVAVKAWLAAEPLQTIDRRMAEAREVISHLPRGARMISVESDTGRRSQLGPSSMTGHIAMMAIIDRDAFVPTLFSGITTVRPHQALLSSSTPNGDIIRIDDLFYGLDKRDDPAPRDDGQGRRIYWLGWEKKFDYVLLEHFGDDPCCIRLPSFLRLIAGSNTANLYRIDR